MQRCVSSEPKSVSYTIHAVKKIVLELDNKRNVYCTIN